MINLECVIAVNILIHVMIIGGLNTEPSRAPAITLIGAKKKRGPIF
jgi:hypothetical protein